MQPLHLLLLLSTHFFSAESVDLTCPQGPIDYHTPSGKFPSTGLAQFPKDYSCAIDFLIPNGWAIKFIVQNNIVSNSGDGITIRDSVSTLNEFGSGEGVFYAPANNSRVWIQTKTSDASFYFSWVFLDITTFKRNEQQTGSIMKLDLTPLNYYAFTSITGPVVLHTATVNNEYDVNLSTVYAYDGDDLSAPFIGNVNNLVVSNLKVMSKKKSLTLVNLYAYTTKSYGIANDYSAISAYAAYGFRLLTSDTPFLGNGNSRPGLTSATTFHCIDSSETYITSILLVNDNVDGQTAHFKPLTPSHLKNAVLTYNAKDNIDSYFPQQILSNTFTMSYSNVDVSLRMQSGPNVLWSVPFAGRKGTIASATMWDPTASPAYNSNFSSPNSFSYSFVLESVVVATPGEKIRLEVGAPYRSQPAIVQFTQTAVKTGTRVANGTYLSTVYTGTNPASNFYMTFAIDDVAPTSPSSTTPAGVQTTTKSTPQAIDLTCPKSPIDINTAPNGSFPNTDGIMTGFPANYSCSIQFNIPVGFVIKFEVDTTAFGDQDTIIIYNTLSMPNDLTIGHTEYYVPANTSTVKITTVTDTSDFYFSWEYQDVSKFGQIESTTGYPMKMTLLPKYYYLFTSNRGPITFHTANINNMRDTWLADIYVYDGADLTAPYLGTLLHLCDNPLWTLWSSSGKSLVLVNYYNNTGNSYGIANDNDAISGFALYNFWLLTSATAGSVQFGAQLGTSAAATFYCVDCTESYITSLSVNQNGVTIPQMVSFQPMSPTVSQTRLLGYTATESINQLMPQQIAGRTFTMVASSVTVSASFVSGPFADWSKATAGRKGSILSPTLWDPSSNAAYTTNFTSSSMMTFTFNLDNVVVAADGEKIRIEVGSPNSTPLVAEFSKTSQHVGSRQANGTYMSTTYNGTSNKSSFWLLFEIEDANQPPSPLTTTGPVITTTKSSSIVSCLNFVVFVLTCFKVFSI